MCPGCWKRSCLAIIRSLPKALRTRFVPAPDAAKQAMAELGQGRGNLRAQVARALSRIGGVEVSATDFAEQCLPPELQMNVRVTDAAGETLAAGRDLDALRRQLGAEAAEAFTAIDDPRWNRDGLTTWDFDELPAEIEVARGRLAMKAHPALVDGEPALPCGSWIRHSARPRKRVSPCGGCSCWPPGGKSRRRSIGCRVWTRRSQLRPCFRASTCGSNWPSCWLHGCTRTRSCPRTGGVRSGVRRGPAADWAGGAGLAGVIGPWFEAYREAHGADAAGGAASAATKPARMSPSPSGRGAGGAGALLSTWGKLALPAAQRKR